MLQQIFSRVEPVKRLPGYLLQSKFLNAYAKQYKQIVGRLLNGQMDNISKSFKSFVAKLLQNLGWT
jgi:hypothetical protein